MEFESDVYRDFDASDDVDVDLDLDLASGHQQDEDGYMEEDNNTITEEVFDTEQHLQVSHDDGISDSSIRDDSIAESSSIHNKNTENAESLQPTSDEDVIIEITSNPNSELYDDEDQAQRNSPEGSQDLSRNGSLSADTQEERYEQIDPKGPNSGYTLGLSCNLLGDSLDPGQVTSSTEIQDSSLKVNDEKLAESLSIGYSEPSTAVSQNVFAKSRKNKKEQENISNARNRHSPKIVTSKSMSGTESSPGQDDEAPLLAVGQEPQTLEHSEGPFLRGSASVHPVTVIYQNNEISLFPLSEDEGEDRSSIYFLQDEQLASDDVRTLLDACRSVLGDSICEQDELMVEIETLGLHICEVGSYCIYTPLTSANSRSLVQIHQTQLSQS